MRFDHARKVEEMILLLHGRKVDDPGLMKENIIINEG